MWCPSQRAVPASVTYTVGHNVVVLAFAAPADLS